MLTPRQFDLLRFLDAEQTQTGITPSYEEIRQALGLKSKSGVHRLITELEARGVVARSKGRSRTLTIITRPEALDKGAQAPPIPPIVSASATETLTINVIGKVAAGLPLEALEAKDREFSLPATLLGSGTYFALVVGGESMVDLGIMDGDVAIIEATPTAASGDIVVAMVHGEEATLKRIYFKGRQIELVAANPAFATQVYPARAVEVRGRLSMIIRRYGGVYSGALAR